MNPKLLNFSKLSQNVNERQLALSTNLYLILISTIVLAIAIINDTIDKSYSVVIARLTRGN